MIERSRADVVPLDTTCTKPGSGKCNARRWRTLERWRERWVFRRVAQSEKSDQWKDAEGRNDAYEEDGQKREPQRLIWSIAVDIRDDEADKRDDDHRKRYPEPYAFLFEDAHR